MMSGVSYSAGAVVGGGFLRCRGCGGRGLWVLIPTSLLLLPVFSSRGSKGAVVVHSFGVGSIGLTHGSIGLTRWSIGLTVLSGSTPGALGDQPKILVRGRVVEGICCSGLHSLYIACYFRLFLHGLKLHECANSMGLFARVWCKKRTFHCPGKYDAKKATILSHLRIF